MKKFIFASLFIVVPALVQSQTQFTVEERNQIASMRIAQASLFSALSSYCGVSTNALDCQKVNLAAYQLGQSVGWLLGINVHANATTGAQILAGPRSGVVAQAWGYLDGALSTLQQAPSLAATPEVVSARTVMLAVNRTLTYSVPFPIFIPCCGTTIIGTNPENQFGPHGHYSAAQSDLWQGYRYAGAAAIDGWLKAIASGELPACPPLPLPQPQVDNRRAVVQNLASFSKVSMQILHMSAQIFTPTNGFPDWATGVRTDAEEALTDPVAKTALTEIHIGAGPIDNAAANNQGTAMASLAAGEMSLGSCLKSAPTTVSQPNVGATVNAIGDGWRHFVAWFGDFNVIR